MPWRDDPFVRWTRHALSIVIALLLVLVVATVGLFISLVNRWHDESVRQAEGARKGLAIVQELTDGNQKVLDQLKVLSDGNAQAVQKQRLSGRCSQWFLITEIRELVADSGGTPIPESVIPVPNVEGLDCKALLTEEIKEAP